MKTILGRLILHSFKKCVHLSILQIVLLGQNYKLQSLGFCNYYNQCALPFLFPNTRSKQEGYEPSFLDSAPHSTHFKKNSCPFCLDLVWENSNVNTGEFLRNVKVFWYTYTLSTLPTKLNLVDKHQKRICVVWF